jgi:4-oxalocrotonate tautomerase
MPMINLQIAAEPNDQLAGVLAQTVTALTAELLGKDPKVTSVAVEFIPPRRWFLGGRSAAELGVSAFFLDTRISDGSNTKDEKARYIAEAFAALHRLLGGVHPESYIHVDDARGDGYGYGGLTQDRRYIEARPRGQRG